MARPSYAGTSASGWRAVLCGCRVSGEQKGRGGLPFYNQAVGRVPGSWRESSPALPPGLPVKWQSGRGGRRVLSGTRRPHFFSALKRLRAALASFPGR